MGDHGDFDEEDPLETWYVSERPNRVVTEAEFKRFLGNVAEETMLGNITHKGYATIIVSDHGYATEGGPENEQKIKSVHSG